MTNTILTSRVTTIHPDVATTIKPNEFEGFQNSATGRPTRSNSIEMNAKRVWGDLRLRALQRSFRMQSLTAGW